MMIGIRRKKTVLSFDVITMIEMNQQLLDQIAQVYETLMYEPDFEISKNLDVLEDIFEVGRENFDLDSANSLAEILVGKFKLAQMKAAAKIMELKVKNARKADYAQAIADYIFHLKNHRGSFSYLLMR